MADRSELDPDYMRARELIRRVEKLGVFKDDDDPHELRDAVKRLNGRMRMAMHFVEWVLALDDPPGTLGAQARQTVTLAQIIERARRV